ncbi:MAG TPA: DNA internalization-related competence protein ComEC/Rec2 [Firmicutes bacterium]|nr:DNA internalization-related competence protein ComEC/Rec2 [Bacillota bacterium]
MRKQSNFWTLLPLLVLGILLGNEKGVSLLLLGSFVALASLWLIATYRSRPRQNGLFWAVIVLGTLLLGQIAAVPLGGGVEETGSFSGVVRSVARLSFDTRTIVRLDSSRIEVAVHLPAHAEVAAGDRITFAGAVVKPPTAANPGAFCYRSYLKRLGVCGLCYPEKFALQPGGGIGLLGAIRNKMRSNLTSQLRAPGLALALVLGERDGLGAEQQERWRQLGISHLLAISGMHVGFFALGLGFVVHRLPLPGLVKLCLIQLIMLGYVLVAGSSVSAWRAFLFSLLGGAAAYRKLHLDGLHIWAVIAWVLLLIRPGYLFEPSFVLSFAAAGGILLWGSTLTVKTRSRALNYLVNSLLISVAAQISLLPFLLGYFGEIALLGPVATLLFLPLTALLLLSALGTACGLGPLGLAKLADLSIGLMGAWENLLLPYAVQWSPTAASLMEPGLWWLLFAYGGWRLRRPTVIRPGRTYLHLALLGAAVLFITTLPPVVRRPLEVTAINVGQGDCYYIKTPSGRHLLIDGGGDSLYWQQRGRNVGEERVVPFLRYRKVPRLDYVILSHPHEDHLFGLLAVLEHFEVGMVIDNGHPLSTLNYERYLELIADKSIAYHQARAGDCLPLGDGITLKVLYPERVRTNLTSAYNNNSLLLKLEYGGQNLLFTGDLENAVLYDLAHTGPGLTAQWLKVPHHGSRGSLLPAFYDAVNPTWAVISTGPNSFGHPHQEVLDFLTGRKIDWRTTADGAVTFLVWWGLFGRFIRGGP